MRGVISKQNNKLLVKVELVDLETEQILRSEQISAPDGDLLRLRGGLTSVIATDFIFYGGAEKTLIKSIRQKIRKKMNNQESAQTRKLDESLKDATGATVAEAQEENNILAFKSWTWDAIQVGDCRIESGARFTLYSDASTHWTCDISSGDTGDEWDEYFRIKIRRTSSSCSIRENIISMFLKGTLKNAGTSIAAQIPNLRDTTTKQRL